MRWLWAVSLSMMSAVWAAESSNEVFWAHGYHGGYFLTSERGYRWSLDDMFELLQVLPAYKAIWELEPYTLERMAIGEQLACERRGRTKPVPAAWSFRAFKNGVGALHSHEAAHAGRWGMRLTIGADTVYVSCYQPLPARRLRGRKLVFSAWVRAHAGKGAHLYIDAHNHKRVIPGSSRRSSFAPPDGRWHKLSIELTVPQPARKIFPQAKIVGGPGQADFDELSLRDARTGEELLDNGGFEELEVASLRLPNYLSKLRESIRAGRAEIVGGAYTQPIMYTIGAESVVRQFVYGCRAVERALGLPVRFYAAQEPDMVGQLPQLLTQLGFEGALFRTHWCIFGSPPHLDAEIVWWAGPDGSRIATVPAYASSPISGYSLPGPSPAKVAALHKAGITRPLFTALGDLAPVHVPAPDWTPLRGKIARGCVNICRRLPATALRGERLLFTAMIRARRPGAHIYVDSHDARGRATNAANSGDVPPDGRWHRVEIRYRVPNDSEHIYPQGKIVTIDGTGEADFDAFSLQMLPGKKELLPNGSFESTQLPTGWGVAKNRGTRGAHEIRTGAAAHGRRYVTLRLIHAPAITIHFTTLAEYFARVGKPKQTWSDAYANFEHRFPFGWFAGRTQRSDREAENAVLQAERLFAIARRDAGPDLHNAWCLTLIGQHHDAWVCAPSIFGIWARGYKTYADVTYEADKEARMLCHRLRKKLLSTPGRRFIVINTSTTPRREVVTVSVELPRGAVRKLAVCDASGRFLPGSCTAHARHDDGSIARATVRVLTEVPALGYIRCEVRDGVSPPLPKVRVQERRGSLCLANESLNVEVTRDGLFKVSASDGQPLLRQPVFLAGRFPMGERRSVVEKVAAKGDAAAVSGRIANVPFNGVIRLDPVSALMGLSIELDFGAKTEVGASEDKRPRLPSFAQNEQKLRLVVPVRDEAPRFYAHGAFEVRPVTKAQWPVVRYALAESGGRGVAIFTDRATAGVFERRPASVALVMGYGGKFIYAPKRYAPLTGRERFEFAFAFYKGDFATCRVPGIAERLAHPLVVSGPSECFNEGRFSLVHVEPQGAAVVTAAYVDGSAVVLRLWRPHRRGGTARVTIADAHTIDEADLRGRAKRQIATGPSAVVTLRPNQIMTLRAVF